jgi:hypothetical protein
MPLWHDVFVQREGVMDTIITLAMLGGAIGFVLGALAELTLNQRENTNV